MSWTISINRSDKGAEVKALGAQQEKLNTSEILEMVFYLELMKKNLLEAFMKVQPSQPLKQEAGDTHGN
jgi:hypothetical protein